MPTAVNLALMVALVVVPLFLFYGKAGAPHGEIKACIIVLPLIMFLITPPLHELSHLAATYLVGGKIEEVRLFPAVSRDGFGLAFIRSSGVSLPSQRVLTALAPYLLDLALLLLASWVFLRRRRLSPSVAGLLFMALCLRGLFDISSNLLCGIVFRSGDFLQVLSELGTGKLYLLGLGLEAVAFSVTIHIIHRGYYRHDPTVVLGTRC